MWGGGRMGWSFVDRRKGIGKVKEKKRKEKKRKGNFRQAYPDGSTSRQSFRPVVLSTQQ